MEQLKIDLNMSQLKTPFHDQMGGKHMRERLAYCGLICQTCPIYLATRTKDGEEQARMRTDITRLLNEHYGMKYTPEDITDCDGCSREEGRLFSGCHNCFIRTCARKKSLENCAYCSEYACENLEALFASESGARKRLEEIRINII